MVDLCPAALKLHKGIAASGSLSGIRDQSACHQENYFLIYEQSVTPVCIFSGEAN